MRLRALILALLAVAALAAAGCGSDNSKNGIPQSDARSLLHRLDQIDENASVGKCRSAAGQVDDLRRRAGNLPSSVKSDVRRALSDGIDRLAQLVQDRCQTPTQTQTETTPTETTPTETTPTQTTPTETTPTETTPTETQTTPTETTPTNTTPTQTTPGTGGTPPGQGDQGNTGTTGGGGKDAKSPGGAHGNGGD